MQTSLSYSHTLQTWKNIESKENKNPTKIQDKFQQNNKKVTVEEKKIFYFILK